MADDSTVSRMGTFFVVVICAPPRLMTCSLNLAKLHHAHDEGVILEHFLQRAMLVSGEVVLLVLVAVP